MGVANWGTAIRESFLHENLIFKQFVKVFTRERNPLYGTLHMLYSEHVNHLRTTSGVCRAGLKAAEGSEAGSQHHTPSYENHLEGMIIFNQNHRWFVVTS